MVWMPCTPRASTPGSAGRTGAAPVAITNLSKRSVHSVKPSLRSTTVTARPSRSMASTSWFRRTSMPRARCSSGERATNFSTSLISPAT
jgi:hypothetical protein